MSDIYTADNWHTPPAKDDHWQIIADDTQSFTIQCALKPLRLRFGGEGGFVWRLWPGQHFTRNVDHPVFQGSVEVKAAHYGGSRHSLIFHESIASSVNQAPSGDMGNLVALELINFGILYMQQLNLNYGLNSNQ